MRHVVVVLVAIPLSLVMAVTFFPATLFDVCADSLRLLKAWRDA